MTPQGPALKRHRLLRMPAGTGSQSWSHACVEAALPEGLVSGTWLPVKPGTFLGRDWGEPFHPCLGSEVIFPTHWVGESGPQGIEPAPSQHLGQPFGIPGSPRGPGCVCESPKAPRRLKAPTQPAMGPTPAFP